MLLVILLGANALGIAAISTLFAELLNYIPSVISAVLVLVLGLLLGEFVKDLVLASAGSLRAAGNLARVAKAAIILLASFMALDQLEIAQDIVLVFFIAVVGAAALAAGIAFGLGGKDIAAEIARDYYERSKLPSRPRSEEQRQAHEPREDASIVPPTHVPPGERRE